MDESFVFNLMKNHFKIMPFWAAKKLEEVTQSGYDMSFKNFAKSQVLEFSFSIYDQSKRFEYGDLINGNLISNCTVPCLLTKVHFCFDRSYPLSY